MANIKISELNEYTNVQDDDLFVIVDVGSEETKKVKATNIGTGGKEIIMVGDDSVATKNTKLLIEQDSLNSLGTEVVNSLTGNETTMAPSVQAINNKFNEISTYSTEERVIGTWLGKPLYRKVINFGSLPNATTKLVTTTLANVNYINMYGMANNETDYFPLNMSRPVSGSNLDLGCRINNNNIVIESATDRSNFNAYIILEYTKTTDSATNTINEEPINEEATI